MRKIVDFNSAFAGPMNQFVSFKRMQGYDYTDQARKLSYFDRFLVAEAGTPQGPDLTLNTLRRYVDTTQHLEAFSRSTRLAAVREFSRYLHARRPDSAVLPKDILPRHKRTVRFFPMTARQVADLMAAVPAILPPDDILTWSLSVLIGLLYSTGLRIGEALNLTLGDIDRQQSTLHVIRGKFGKERLVPVSVSTLNAVTGYLTVRKPHAGNSLSSPLFIAAYDTALNHDQAYYYFRRLCRHCGIWGDPPPRPHDLRHNYACARLALWREQGMDLNAMLPVLATAMGHVNIFTTQRYLHVDAVGMLDALDKFDTYITTHSE